MSHIVTIKTQFKNIDTIKKVCNQMNAEILKDSSKIIFGHKIEGTLLQFKDSYFPIAIDKNGELQYDNMDSELIQNELIKFKNLYTLYETEIKLKQQHLKYRILQNNPQEEIKIEVNLS